MGPAPIKSVGQRNQLINWTETGLFCLLEESWNYTKECASPWKRCQEWAVRFPHLLLPPQRSTWNHRRCAPWFTEELFAVFPAFPFPILQLLWWRQSLPRRWSLLFCLQVHQLHSCLYRSSDPSPSTILLPNHLSVIGDTGQFWFWILSRWKFLEGAIANLKGRAFLKELFFFWPFVLLSSSLECKDAAQRSTSHLAMRRQLIQGWKIASY